MPTSDEHPTGGNSLANQLLERNGGEVCMSIETIDTAIFAHRAWVSRFQTSLNGSNTEIFELATARDYTACSLGQWLSSPRSIELLGSESHTRITLLHSTFHEIAGEIADGLNQYRSIDDSQALLNEFDNLSRQLVQLLMLAKKRI